jgi:RNA polymerase subunit RPABC4/transcription elongation factor Spt4
VTQFSDQASLPTSVNELIGLVGLRWQRGQVMGWYLRKSVKMGPVRLNVSKRGLGVSTGVKGFRIGAVPNGPYVAGGRGGIYFRQSLRARTPRRAPAQATRAAIPMWQGMTQQPNPPQSQPQAPLSAQTSTAAAAQQSAYGPPPAPRAYHAYRGVTLTILTIGNALGWLLAIANSSTQSASQTASDANSLGLVGSLGMLVWLGSMIAIAVIDWSGFISLRGRIHWWRLSSGAKFWLVCAYIFTFEIMMPIYLVGAWIDFRRARLTEEQQRPFRIAQMESELGLAPATEGTCAACGKPLQVGAEFCGYCRAPVAARPKVCSSCAAVTLPDANWCPKCGASLTSQP